MKLTTDNNSWKKPISKTVKNEWAEDETWWDET